MGYSRILYFFLYLIVETCQVSSITTRIDHNQPVRNFRRHTSPLPFTDWELGLRESVHQALLREHHTEPTLREQLLQAPLIGRQNNASPFGDIAVLARGQLYVTSEGFKFVQDSDQDDCTDCHNPRCATSSQCQWKILGHHHKLLALWTVKRIRHRDPSYGHAFEIEYTIAPITSPINEELVRRHGFFNYNVPGHIFVIKSDPRLNSAYHLNGNGDKWHKNQAQHPVDHNQNQGSGHFKPGILIGVTSDGYKHVLHSFPGFYSSYHPQNQYDHTTVDPKEYELYKKLIESLASKTSNVPHRFSATTPAEKTTTKPTYVTTFIPVPQTTYVQFPDGQVIPLTDTVQPTTTQLVTPVKFATSQPTQVTKYSEPDIFYHTVPTTQVTSEPPKPITVPASPVTTVHYYSPVEKPNKMSTATTPKKVIATTSKSTKRPTTLPAIDTFDIFTLKPIQKTTRRFTTPQKITERITISQKTTAPQETTAKFTTPRETTAKFTTHQETTEKFTTPQDTTAKFTTSQEATAKFTTPQKSTAKFTTPQETIEKFTTPQEITAKFTTPRETTAKFTTYRESTEKFTTPQFTISQEATAKFTTPQKTTAKFTTPQETTAKPTTPQKITAKFTTPQETTAKRTTPQKSIARYTTPQETTAKFTTPQETTAKFTTPQETTAKSTTLQKTTAKFTTPQETTAKFTTQKPTQAVAEEAEQFDLFPVITSTEPMKPVTESPKETSPDSINEQLPAPNKDVDTTIPYVSSTVTQPSTVQTERVTIGVTKPVKGEETTVEQKRTSIFVPSTTEEITTIIEKIPYTEKGTTVIEKIPYTEEGTTMIEKIPYTEGKTTVIVPSSTTQEERTTTPSRQGKSTTVTDNVYTVTAVVPATVVETSTSRGQSTTIPATTFDQVTTQLFAIISGSVPTTQRTSYDKPTTIYTYAFDSTTEPFGSTLNTLPPTTHHQSTTSEFPSTEPLKFTLPTTTSHYFYTFDMDVPEPSTVRTDGTTLIQPTTHKEPETTMSTKQTTQKRKVPKVSSTTTDDFLVDSETEKQTNRITDTKKEFNEDDIFGQPQIKSSTELPETTTKSVVQSDVASALFGGTRSKRIKLSSKITKRPVTNTTKIIYTNFYTARSPKPTVSSTTNFDSTVESRPSTDQSFSTSISFEVNKRNSTKPTVVHLEPTTEVNHEVYEATVVAVNTTTERNKSETKKVFDDLALQLVNHARSIDYLHEKPKRQPKYRRRSYVTRRKSSRRRISNNDDN